MAKLLLPYRPDRPLAEAQEQVGRDIVAECNRVGIPVVLEPLFYQLDDPSLRPKLVLKRLGFARRPDAELPFPVDPSDPDEDHWFAACRTISEIAPMPWVLLSGGGSFETYLQQVEVAVRAGGSGFMVGRALWGEAALANADERSRVLDELVRPRMRRLRAIID